MENKQWEKYRRGKREQEGSNRELEQNKERRRSAKRIREEEDSKQGITENGRGGNRGRDN